MKFVILKCIDIKYASLKAASIEVIRESNKAWFGYPKSWSQEKRDIHGYRVYAKDLWKEVEDNG